MLGGGGGGKKPICVILHCKYEEKIGSQLLVCSACQVSLHYDKIEIVFEN